MRMATSRADLGFDRNTSNLVSDWAYPWVTLPKIRLCFTFGVRLVVGLLGKWVVGIRGLACRPLPRTQTEMYLKPWQNHSGQRRPPLIHQRSFVASCRVIR